MKARSVVALSFLVPVGCAIVRTTPDDSATGGAPSEGGSQVGGPGSGGQGLGTPTGGAASGGSGGAGAGGVEPSLPPCFPQGVDDFSEPAASEATWAAVNATFVGERALLGVVPDDLGLLGVEGTLEGACFVSFVIEPVPDGDDAIDAYVLLKPAFPDDTFDDLDVQVTMDTVRLYVRPDGPVRSVPRTGNRFLLVIEGSTATLHQTNGPAWSFVDALETPSPLAEAQLVFTHYDATPAFFVDEVSVLPPELAALPTGE